METRRIGSLEVSVVGVHPGLGSHPYETGTSFRVWAPFADAVFVAGDFNGWNDAAHPLAPEGDGYWSRDLEGVGDRALYKYVVVRGAERLWKNNPYAREVTSSAGDSVVRRLAFTWDGEEGYRTPPWHVFLVLQHIWRCPVTIFCRMPENPAGRVETLRAGFVPCETPWASARRRETSRGAVKISGAGRNPLSRRQTLRDAARRSKPSQNFARRRAVL